MKHRTLAFVLAWSCCLSFSIATDAPKILAADDWVGQKVMPKMNCELREKGRVIKDSKQNRVPYQVMQTQGDWLLVGDRVPGWVKATDVVKLDEASAYYAEVIRENPKSTLALIRRAIAAQELQQIDAALVDYDEAIKLEPKNALALNNRGSLHSQKGDHRQAILDFNEALKIDPKVTQALVNRGSELATQNRYDEALKDFDAALALDPHHSRAHYNRGSVYETKGNFDKAIIEYKEAIRCNPRDPLAYNNLAWLLATSPNDKIRNGAAAVELATKACELTASKDAENLDTLAAAYAEAGNWAKAVETVQAAEKLAADDFKKELAAREKLYAAKQPYRNK
jgi:tetratricopeptide (TPR) repeat protein